LKRDPQTFYKVYLIFFRWNLVPVLLPSDYFQDLQDYALAGIPKISREPRISREKFLLDMALAPEFYAASLLLGPEGYKERWSKLLQVLEKRYPDPLLCYNFIMIVHAVSHYAYILFDEEDMAGPMSKLRYHEKLMMLETYITNTLEDLRAQEKLSHKLNKKSYIKKHQEGQK